VLARHDAFRVRAVRVGQVDEQGQRAAGSKCCHDGVRAGEAGHLDVVGIPVTRLNTHLGAFNNFLYDCARLSAVQTRVSVASYRRAQVDNARPGGVGSHQWQLAHVSAVMQRSRYVLSSSSIVEKMTALTFELCRLAFGCCTFRSCAARPLPRRVTRLRVVVW